MVSALESAQFDELIGVFTDIGMSSVAAAEIYKTGRKTIYSELTDTCAAPESSSHLISVQNEWIRAESDRSALTFLSTTSLRRRRRRRTDLRRVDSELTRFLDTRDTFSSSKRPYTGHLSCCRDFDALGQGVSQIPFGPDPRFYNSYHRSTRRYITSPSTQLRSQVGFLSLC